MDNELVQLHADIRQLERTVASLCATIATMQSQLNKLETITEQNSVTIQRALGGIAVIGGGLTLALIGWNMAVELVRKAIRGE